LRRLGMGRGRRVNDRVAGLDSDRSELCDLLPAKLGDARTQTSLYRFWVLVALGRLGCIKCHRY
jgi:hypothetical protein